MLSKTCKFCGSTSDQVKWVTKHGKVEGLVCALCTAKKQLAKKATKEGAIAIKEAQLKCSRKVRATAEGKAKANKAAVDSNTKRRSIDPLYALKIKLRNRINNSFHRLSQAKLLSSTERSGLTSEAIAIQLVKASGLSLEEARLLVIDHILPMNLARTAEDAETLNHPSNLQLITKQANDEKSDFLVDGRRARDLSDKEAGELVNILRLTIKNIK